ncbi:MAG TPA: polyribonucleotide nucleotidyltransferase [Planctomycetota bacterium]|jgi:polyribonucleotide nucleotidyltransferase
MAYQTVEMELGGRKLKIETGKIAKQASGSAVVTLGETIVLAAVSEQPIAEGFDFFPLTVDYREKGYASGMIFGGRFQKREGRPSDKETLTMRLIDRPIRPLWPTGYTRDVLVQCYALSAEPDVDPDVLAMIAASTALSVSSLPFQGPIGAVRVGLVDGQFKLNPTGTELEASALELVVAGSADSVLMVESGAKELSEDQMIGAIEFGHEQIKRIVALQKELIAKVQPVKNEFVPPAEHPITQVIVKEYLNAAKKAAMTQTKFGRRDALKKLRNELVEKYSKEALEKAGKPVNESTPSAWHVKAAYEALHEKAIRTLIMEGVRCDGRSREQVRPITIEIGVLPRAHGSAIFTRGETQALCITTMGTVSDEQTVESLRGEFTDKFMLHYNFPSFSVGEVKMPRGPGRREIGHGYLARRSIKPMLPDYEKFPYTLRVVSEILESNGSSSMASVCGGTLALFDAGVPMKAPVAGIAMGLVEENGQHYIVTDILGDEDHYGDMDFKVAGTMNGVTALQMDLKSQGIPTSVMRKALEQAKAGRIHILGEMAKAISEPRSNISQHAPKIIQMKIDPEKIGKLIGPGGKMIRSLEEKYKVTIEVSDDGSVVVASPKRDEAEAAKLVIEGLVGTPEVGRIYMGEVVNIKEFGVFFEITPGTDGMCHVSELDVAYIKDPHDFCKVGDKMEVKLIAVDDLGRLKLSRKAVIAPGSESVPAPAGEGGPRGGGGHRREGGGGRDRGGHGGGDRGGRRGDRGGHGGDRGPREHREHSGPSPLDRPSEPQAAPQTPPAPPANEPPTA